MSDPSVPGPVFAFEDLGNDLPRPPLSAIRFFRRSGIKLGLRSWQGLGIEVRWAMATEGSRNDIDPHIAKTLVRAIPLRDLELVDDRTTPEGEPAPGLSESLGQPSDWTTRVWPTLPPFHRFVLNVLRNNKRLLWRAYAEMLGLRMLRDDWRGPVAHTELLLNSGGEAPRELLRLLATERLLDGRGLLLARASGRRAARQAGELFDLHSDVATGAVELDWAVQIPTGTVLWQAHVSTHTGEFHSAASLVASTVAAVSLFDMLKTFDVRPVLREAKIVEEEWQVGRLDGEASTAVFRAR